jgi:opacity protein-like surface antigen
MKRFLGYAALLALLSCPAFAAKNSEKVIIAHPVTVGATQLPAGEYKVTWSETSSNAQVTLTHGTSVVKLPAKVVEQKHDNVTVLTDNKGGTEILKGINFTKVSVEFTSSPSSGQ